MIDELGDRMKAYEGAANRTLIKRMPVIIRLDGKAFHTLTRPFKNKENEEPYDVRFHVCMCETMKALCENVQNAVFGYTQSDEISILLKDWTTFETQQWFGGSLQKMVSVSASLATAEFNQQLNWSGLDKIVKNYALFDARVYNIPREDVTNYFVWRQKDAIRNSVNMLGQHHFSHKQLEGMSVDTVKAYLLSAKDIYWDDLDEWKQRGSVWKKEPTITTFGDSPLFTADRNYIDKLLE